MTTFLIIAAIIVVLVGVAYSKGKIGGRLGKELDRVTGKNKPDDVVSPTSTPSKFYPCVIDGSFSMPSHEARIAARNTSLVKHGHAVTGDDSIDNATLGGGTPDGGIWLSGSFHFEVDANGQNTSDSWISVFSTERHPVTGGVTPSGDIGMGSVAGVGIAGKINNGVVTGKVAESGMYVEVAGSHPGLEGIPTTIDGKPHLQYVHGVMSGTAVLR